MTEYSVFVDQERLKSEIWTDLYLDGLKYPYLISNCGRIKSLRKNIILKYSFDAFTYPQFILYGNGKRIGKRTHILVGLHFVENDDPENKTELNHKDGNKTNPYAYNLEWCTRIHNLKHRDETGLGCKFNAYNHPRRKQVIHIPSGQIFESVKLASIHADVPSLSVYLTGKIKNKLPYEFYEPEIEMI